MKYFQKECTDKSIPIFVVSEQEWEAHDKSEKCLNESILEKFKGEGFQVFIDTDKKGVIVKVYAGISFSENDPRNWMFLFANLAKTLPSGVYQPEGIPEDKWYDAGIGWGLGFYEFTRYKKTKKTEEIKKLLVPETAQVQTWIHTLESVFLARDLINTPANDLGPYDMANQAKELAEAFQAELNVIKGADLLLEGYPAVYTVGHGSDRAPALIDMNWGDQNNPKLTLVGKGVVFDTGGLNLKSAAGMRNMKKDMGGGAVAMALAQLIMAENLPVRLRLLIPTVENSPGMRGYRPGDVIQTRKGLSVEIGNTDAEGRVILCDALASAAEENPDLILDFATLTGAARVALGQDLPPFYTPQKELADVIHEAAEEVKDPLWQMPLWEPYYKYLKSDIADLNNIANTPLAGSMTAALYLWEFVKPLSNWVHLDIFGWRNDAMPGFPEGGEANSLRAIYRFLEKRYSSR